MIAVDTNVIVRLLTEDDAAQAAVARSLFAAGPVWIAKTVLLETAWVLRSAYNFDDAAVREALTKLLGLKNAHVEDEPSVSGALELASHGVQFADALHVASRPPGTTFVSFDRSFVRRAQRAGAPRLSELPLRRS